MWISTSHGVKGAGSDPRVGVPPSMGAELIELVRRNTGLSYDLSRVAIGVVIGHIQSSLPHTAEVMEQVLLSLVESKKQELSQQHVEFLPCLTAEGSPH
ncbi:UNVERIFIED_CONTAM: hypothetical protein FKN15_027732 [Acipenser sinensis]